MNINELFEEIQNEFHPEELRGEFLLQGNVIIWSYNLSDDAEDLTEFDEDEEEFAFGFETESSEELLLEAYKEDFIKIEEFLDEIDEINNWTLTEVEFVDEVALFKLF